MYWAHSLPINVYLSLTVMNVSFVDTDLVVREGEGFVSFSLSKTEGAIGPVSVQVTTEPGSATSKVYSISSTQMKFVLFFV